MDLNPIDRRLIAALEDGLPICAEPYAALARELEMTESEVLDRLRALNARGVFSRFGLVVRHHELGYRANAMVVWDVPDDEVSAVGRLLASYPCVTLCYRRPRRLPIWPYNLFCMVHGQNRADVRLLVHDMTRDLSLCETPRDILFSNRRFKQRGARYGDATAIERRA